MKLERLLALFIAGTALAATATNKSADPLSISISTPNSTVELGSPVQIDIVAKNVSASPIRISKTVAEDRAELDFEVIVRKRDDGDAKETRWGRRIHGKDAEDAHSGMSIVSGDLPTGGVMKETTFVDRIYDLNALGQYTIRIEKRAPDHTLLGKSNTLTITVVN
jgi:hypothetical protein